MRLFQAETQPSRRRWSQRIAAPGLCVQFINFTVSCYVYVGVLIADLMYWFNGVEKRWLYESETGGGFCRTTGSVKRAIWREKTYMKLTLLYFFTVKRQTVYHCQLPCISRGGPSFPNWGRRPSRRANPTLRQFFYHTLIKEMWGGGALS